jgi:hypothetical protein
LAAFLVPDQCWQFDVLAAQADGFFGPQPAVVQDAEEGYEAWPAGLLDAAGFEQRPRLGRIDDDSTIHLGGYLGALAI